MQFRIRTLDGSLSAICVWPTLPREGDTVVVKKFGYPAVMLVLHVQWCDEDGPLNFGELNTDPEVTVVVVESPEKTLVTV